MLLFQKKPGRPYNLKKTELGIGQMINFANVKDAVAIAEFKYPRVQFDIVWLFDQSSSHTAKSCDALVANKMNVHPDGIQPKMHDIIYNDVVRKTVDDNGIPKGSKQVLVERNVHVTNTIRLQR